MQRRDELLLPRRLYLVPPHHCFRPPRAGAPLRRNLLLLLPMVISRPLWNHAKAAVYPIPWEHGAQRNRLIKFSDGVARNDSCIRLGVETRRFEAALSGRSPHFPFPPPAHTDMSCPGPRDTLELKSFQEPGDDPALPRSIQDGLCRDYVILVPQSLPA